MTRLERKAIEFKALGMSEREIALLVTPLAELQREVIPSAFAASDRQVELNRQENEKKLKLSLNVT